MATVIQIKGLHKHYGTTAIFDDAELAIDDDHRIGVVGRNGAGKTTLCRMLLGEEQADAGSIAIRNDLRLSYLEQHDPFKEGEIVLAFLERYSGQPPWGCARMAARFRIDEQMLQVPVASLSGGYQTRIKLAGMLLRDPQFLILDEPSNYLDVSTQLLLESVLSDFPGGFLVVSHDREFLKRTCSETVEVGGGRITFYPGPIEEFLADKAERLRHAEHANVAIAQRRKQLQTFVDRNRAKASKASQAQSKLKMISRLRPISIDNPLTATRIHIPAAETRSGTALRCQNLAIGYPGRRVAEGIDLDIERGRHVAVVGDNGQGKTTFLSTLAGTLPALGGNIRWGYGVRIGHYAQHVYASLDRTRTVRQHLDRCANDAPVRPSIQEILDLAGAFLFPGDRVDVRIEALSGGERSRLCLAGLLLGRFPVLILDEPTNHLDVETVEALGNALRSFDGTIFFTCHDRTFVSIVASDVIEVRDGTVRLYPDDYGTYVDRIERSLAESLMAPMPAASEAATGASGIPKPPTRAAAAIPVRASDRHERLKRCRNLLRSSEARMSALEAEKSSLETALSNGGPPQIEAAKRLALVIGLITSQESTWLQLQQEIESLEGN